jgi:hypothetical protein
MQSPEDREFCGLPADTFDLHHLTDEIDISVRKDFDAIRIWSTSKYLR